MKKPRKTYSEEFKRDGVKLLTRGGDTFKVASEQLGVSPSALLKWKNRYEGNLPEPSVDEEEVNRLREENRRLKMERDILKRRQPSSPRKITEI